MATPTYHIPPPSAEEIISRLEKEVVFQDEATPEPKFEDENVEQSYQWLCEIERNRFTVEEVDNIRSDISAPRYWECEARHLKDKLSMVIWEKLLDQYARGGDPTREDWQKIITGYERRLKVQGLSTTQVRGSRLAINDQSYWEPESERLRQASALREYGIKEAYLERQPYDRSRSSSPRSRTHHQGPKPGLRRKRVKQPARRLTRAQSDLGTSRTDRVLRRKKSCLRSLAASKM